MGKVTLKAIAAKTGVSATTVSMALSGNYRKHRIKPEVAERIRKAAREMGYIPDIHARRMRTGKPHFVIAVMTAYEAPINLVGSLLKTTEQYLQARSDDSCQYSLIMINFHAGRLSELSAFIAADRFHGAIISNTLPEDDRFLAENPPAFPVVLIGRRIPGFSALLSDPDASGDVAANTLMAAGCQSYAVLRPKALTQTTRNRVDSFVRVVKEGGLSRPVEIVCDDLSESAACRAMTTFLEDARPLDGLFAISDILVPGAYHAIKTAGLRIPQDIKVMGTDNLSFSAFLDPPLTTIAVKRNDHLQEAVRLLTGMLNGSINERIEIRIASEVILRQSTASDTPDNPND